MIRRHLMTLRAGLMLLDGVVAALVFVTVAAIRFRESPIEDAPEPEAEESA